MPEKLTTFVVTEDHLKLLRAMYWGHNDEVEFGGPWVDPKRPFGFSGGYYEDMAQILGRQYVDDDGELVAYLHKLYRELYLVVEIAICTGVFEPGEYESPMRHPREWRGPYLTERYKEQRDAIEAARLPEEGRTDG